MTIEDLLNRKILIASMHKKENVIAPILKDRFALRVFPSENFNTDLLGTFSGEIPRIKSPIETIKEKAKTALNLTDFDLVIASEGSFGAHPSFFFSACNEEFLYLYDKTYNFEILVKSLELDTNFCAKNISSKDEFISFLDEVKFPSHAIILRDEESLRIEKGITNRKTALQIFDLFITNNSYVICETDMRAMYNPTRMAHIARLTTKLCDTIENCCPNCKYPGFQVTDIKTGLPCLLCKSPTDSTKSYILSCINCKHQEENEFPHGKMNEDPQYCPNCNP